MHHGGFRQLRKVRAPRMLQGTVLQKVNRDRAVGRLRDLADRLEPKVRKAFEDALEDLRERAQLEELTRRLEDNDIQGVLALLSAEVTREVFAPLAAEITNAAAEGGRVAADIQEPVQGPQGQQVNFVFDVANPRIQQFAQEQAATRIREIGDDVREVVRQVITEETQRGTNPRDTARRVRQAVGLTARQERAVQNFRRMLETGDPAALNRELRDQRFDPSIRRAIEGESLSQEKIDRMVERYRQRFIQHRAETIARTETIRATQGAQHELFQSYVDQGRIAQNQVRRFWVYTKDERTRAHHRAIPGMNERGVGLNQAFQTPLGPLRFPGDPQGLPENTVNCRCVVFPRVVSAELAEEQS